MIQDKSFVCVNLENLLEVERSEPPAKIIVNSRTGTLVISGNVKVTPAAVSHGTLSVRVNEDQMSTLVMQSQLVRAHRQKCSSSRGSRYRYTQLTKK